MRIALAILTLLAAGLMGVSCSSTTWSSQLIVSPGGKASFQGGRKEVHVRNLGPGTVQVTETSADGEVLASIPLTAGGTADLVIAEDSRLTFENESDEKADVRITPSPH